MALSIARSLKREEKGTAGYSGQKKVVVLWEREVGEKKIIQVKLGGG